MNLALIYDYPRDDYDEITIFCAGAELGLGFYPRQFADSLGINSIVSIGAIPYVLTHCLLLHLCEHVYMRGYLSIIDGQVLPMLQWLDTRIEDRLKGCLAAHDGHSNAIFNRRLH